MSSSPDQPQRACPGIKGTTTASNNCLTGTPEENAAIVQGSNAFYGTYTVKDRALTHKIDGGTWAAWSGTAQQRQIGEMKWAIVGTLGEARLRGGVSVGTLRSTAASGLALGNECPRAVEHPPRASYRFEAPRGGSHEK